MVEPIRCGVSVKNERGSLTADSNALCFATYDLRPAPQGRSVDPVSGSSRQTDFCRFSQQRPRRGVSQSGRQNRVLSVGYPLNPPQKGYTKAIPQPLPKLRKPPGPPFHKRREVDQDDRPGWVWGLDPKGFKSSMPGSQLFLSHFDLPEPKRPCSGVPPL